MIGLNPGCLTGIPEWDRYKSVRYVSDTGGVLSQGVGENTHVKYGVGKSNKNLSRPGDNLIRAIQCSHFKTQAGCILLK